MPFKKILVPVDFSACSRAALGYASLLQKTFDATVHVVHACEIPSMVPTHVVVMMGDLDAPLMDHIEREAKVQLAEFLKQNAADCELTHEVRLGPPAATVLSTIEDGDYDLIVMGTHGRSGLPRLMLGSVAEKVVRGAHVPVLTIPLEDK